MINDLNSMKELDPITIGLLKSDYYKKILLDKKSSIKEIKILMKNHPDNEEAYFEYWSIIKEKGDIDKLEVISNKLEKVCSSNNVPINSWVNSLFKRSEMMVLKGNKYTNPQDRFDPNGVYSNFIEEAIRALKKISASLPPLPLPALLTIEDPIKIKEDLLDNLNLDERKLSKESETKSKDQDAYELETSFLGFNIRKITAKNTDFGSILSKSDGRSRASDNSDAEYKPLLCKKTSGSTPGHNYTPQTPSTPAGHQYPNSKHFTPRIESLKNFKILKKLTNSAQYLFALDQLFFFTLLLQALERLLQEPFCFSVVSDLVEDDSYEEDCFRESGVLSHGG